VNFNIRVWPVPLLIAALLLLMFGLYLAYSVIGGILSISLGQLLVWGLFFTAGYLIGNQR
jgi:hypothetical protein